MRGRLGAMTARQDSTTGKKELRVMNRVQFIARERRARSPLQTTRNYRRSVGSSGSPSQTLTPWAGRDSGASGSRDLSNV